MAVGMHFVTVTPINIDRLGNPLLKDDYTVSIRQQMDASKSPRILADPAVPNSAAYPTIQDYLTLEAAAGYVVYHIDQTMIITYAVADL